jgi:hypothetical protein
MRFSDVRFLPGEISDRYPNVAGDFRDNNDTASTVVGEIYFLMSHLDSCRRHYLESEKS